MRIHVVSIRSGPSAEASAFVGSGFLVDRCHVLTAAHVWKQAASANAAIYVGALPDCDSPLAATLSAQHETRDAAILRITEWHAPREVLPPVLAREYRTLDGEAVELRAMSPSHPKVMTAPSYCVSSYDNEWQEYELTPEVARGNSGGAAVHGDEVIGLIAKRAENEPLTRALAMHSLLAWIGSVIGSENAGQTPVAVPAEASVASPPRAVDSARGVSGLSHRLGSIHLHVDGVSARDYVRELVARHARAGQDAELAYVVEARGGPQRRELAGDYDQHNPGPGGDGELDYFSTTQLHPGPDLPTQTQRRKIALDVHDVLCELHALGDGAKHVVVELERVVGAVDVGGHVEMSPRLAMRGTSASLEALPAMGLFALFNQRRVVPPGASAYELHFSLDLDRHGHRPPVALEDLCELVRRAGIELGGWFLFQDETRWAYRSNGFLPSISSFALQSRWKRLRAQLDESHNAALRGGRLRLLAEETIAVWRTPLMLASEDLRSVDALADWEATHDDLKEFWVLLPNFLGDQNDQVRVAMLKNLNKGVRYVYFLRSNADARRWLDFRSEMRQEADGAERLMTAYVVAFNASGAWEQPAAFIANPHSPRAEGFDLHVDTASNRVIYGKRMAAERILAIVDTHSRAVTNDAIVGWHLVQASGSEQTVTAVCAHLIDEPSETLFGRLDSRLALLASQHGGSVEVYGNKSITIVFIGHRSAAELALQFVRRAMADCEGLQTQAETFVLRFGVASGAACLTARACGMLWTGPAIRSSRRVLDTSPRRAGVFTAAGSRIVFSDREGEALVATVSDGGPERAV